MDGRETRENPAYIDDDERESVEAFEASLESGAFKSTLTEDRKRELESAARRTLNPIKKQISARLFEHDIIKLKARAAELGIPYQTLLTSIVHQYVEGRLVEKKI
jgi:predicted DNA binding CopG/RHH family protein